MNCPTQTAVRCFLGRFRCGIILCTLLAAEPLLSDWSRVAPRSLASENGRYRVEIDGIPPPSVGACMASLLDSTNGTDTVVWQRPLINNAGPLHVLVANSGPHVVTLGDWGWTENERAQFELVIYGPSGEAVLALPRLKLLPESFPDPFYTALVFFDSSEHFCAIRGAGGLTLLFELSSGELVDQEWYEASKGWHISESEWETLQSSVHSELRRHALRGLSSPAPSRRGVAALVCGEEGYTEAAPILKKMLEDSTRIHGGRGNVTVGEAARAALATLQTGQVSNAEEARQGSDRARQGQTETIEDSPDAAD